MLLRQIQEEEQRYFEEYIKHVENKNSHVYNPNQMRDQIIPDALSQDIMTRGHKSVIVMKGSKIQNLQGSFKDKPT